MNIKPKAELQALADKRKGELVRRCARYEDMTELNKKQRRRMRAAFLRYQAALRVLCYGS